MNRMSTGVLLLDSIIGGGIPLGSVTCICGHPSAAKTTLGLSCLREASELGPVAYVATEEVPDSRYMRNASSEDALIVRPEYGEGGAEAVYTLLKEGVRMVVLDSTDAMLPVAEAKAPVGSRIWSAQTRLLFHSLATIRAYLRGKQAAVIVISQVRTNMKTRKVMESTYGDLRSLLDYVVFLDRRKFQTQYGEFDRASIRARVTHSKYTPPGATTSFTVWHKKGIDRGTETLNYLLSTGDAKRSGPYWVVGGEKFGPGFKAASNEMSKILEVRSNWGEDD